MDSFAGRGRPPLPAIGRYAHTAPGIYLHGDPALARQDQPKLEGATVLFSAAAREGPLSTNAPWGGLNVEGSSFDGGTEFVGGDDRERAFRDVTVRCEAPGFEAVERKFDIPEPGGMDLRIVAILAMKSETATVPSAGRH